MDFTERAPRRLALIRFLETGKISKVKNGKNHLDIGKSMNRGVRTSFPLQDHRDS